MSCKTLLEDENTTVIPVISDTVYNGTLTSPFETDLYSFEMVESEIMTFNFNITAFTQAIELVLELYKYNESTQEYDHIGTSFITQTVNVIDYDVTPGKYAFCLTTDYPTMTYDMLLEFTEFPYIVFPIATASDGSNCYLNFPEGEITFCDNVIVYWIIAGNLPPGFTMGNNGVIQGLLPELDCVLNDPYSKGINAPVSEFEVNFKYGSHALLYNYGPDDFAILTGSNVDIDLWVNIHAGQDFLAEYGDLATVELTNYKEFEFYHGSNVEVDFTIYPLEFSNGDNYNITNLEIPPSFTLANNNQGDGNYWPTGVEWEFTVRAAFDEDKSQFKDRTFTICISNNWDTDKAAFENAEDDFESDVFIEEELLNAESIEDLAEIEVFTDNELIPEQPDNFDGIIEAALSQVVEVIVEEPELCMPCVVIELPRIRPIETGLCVCTTEVEEVEIVEPELVKGIENNCASEFLNSMLTEMACIPIQPCGLPAIYIRDRKVRETIVIEPQCDDTCE